MNLSKHMEFVFLGALILIGATAGATAAVPELLAPLAPAHIAAVRHNDVPTVVVVSAKRLTAAEKAVLAD